MGSSSCVILFCLKHEGVFWKIPNGLKCLFEWIPHLCFCDWDKYTNTCDNVLLIKRKTNFLVFQVSQTCDLNWNRWVWKTRRTKTLFFPSKTDMRRHVKNDQSKEASSFFSFLPIEFKGLYEFSAEDKFSIVVDTTRSLSFFDWPGCMALSMDDVRVNEYSCSRWFLEPTPLKYGCPTC